MKKVFFVLLCVVSPLCLVAQERDNLAPETLLIDVPTAEVFDKYQASFLTRAYSHGTLMQSIDFGVYPRLNIGASVAVHELLGSSSDVKVLDPAMQLKWKVYDGSLYLPAIAIGYDGRRYGYGYEHYYYTYEGNYNKEYMDSSKGVYIAMTREIIVPGLMATLGGNVSGWDWEKIYGFTGLFYKLGRNVAVMMEWDQIRNIRDSRLNAGVRFYLHPSLAMDAAVRRIGRGDESERLLQLRYTAHF